MNRAELAEKLAKFIMRKEAMNCKTLEENMYHQSTWKRVIPEAEEILTELFGADSSPATELAAKWDEGAEPKTETRWQDAIYELCKKAVGAENDYLIDGGGCDSGDALDVSLAEISQAIGFWRDKAEAIPTPMPSEKCPHCEQVIQGVDQHGRNICHPAEPPAPSAEPGPHCDGYPKCDGNLPGEPHETDCPAQDGEEAATLGFTEWYARYSEGPPYSLAMPIPAVVRNAEAYAKYIAARRAPQDGPKDDSRCAVCGWPLAQSWKEGCVRGNCSMRPFPKTYYDRDRFDRECSLPTPPEKEAGK